MSTAAHSTGPRFGALAVILVAGVVRIASGQCSLELAGLPVAGATVYEFEAVAIDSCDFEYSGVFAETNRWRLAESSLPQVLIESSPPFRGWFTMRARSAAGSILAEQVVAGAWNSQNAPIGTPYGDVDPPVQYLACAGERIEISSGIVAASGVTYQWRRDGVDLVGENFPTLSITPGSAGMETYEVVATNECGATSVGPFVVAVASASRPAVTRWIRAEEGIRIWPEPREFACIYCGGGVVESTRIGTCTTDVLQFGPGEFSVEFEGGAGSGLRNLAWVDVEFEVRQPALMSISAIYTCLPPYCANFTGSITGPGFSFPLVDVGESCSPLSEQTLLQVGTYRFRLSGAGGDPCQQCGCIDCNNSEALDCACRSQPHSWTGTLRFDRASCLEDLNFDGVVSAGDFAQLLTAWGSSGEDAADLDGDGVVGAADVARLLAAWGPCR